MVLINLIIPTPIILVQSSQLPTKVQLLSQSRIFDAWGRYRDPNTWQYISGETAFANNPQWLYRGYTGHEHLAVFDLINMNGRIYDPIIGRF